MKSSHDLNNVNNRKSTIIRYVYQEGTLKFKTACCFPHKHDILVEVVVLILRKKPEELMIYLRFQKFYDIFVFT